MAASAHEASTTPTDWWQRTSARSMSMTAVCTWAPFARRTSPNWTCEQLTPSRSFEKCEAVTGKLQVCQVPPLVFEEERTGMAVRR